jgi:hypothetical protein
VVESYWIAIASLIVSTTTIIFGSIGLRQKAKISYVSQLETKVESLRSELKDCEKKHEISEEKYKETLAENKRLFRERIDLLEQIFRKNKEIEELKSK